MATSGTAAWNIDILDLIEEAYERAGTSARTGNDFRTARRSLNLLSAEWSNRGLNLWTVEQGTVALVDGTAQYTLPTDTIDIIEAVLRTSSGGQTTDYILDRLGVSDWAGIVTKTTEGRPVQFYVERHIQPRVSLWPIPDVSTYTLVYWRLRRMQDATTGTDTMDIPFRFIPALVAGLAYQIALKRPELAGRLAILKADYEEQFRLAADEDRERASLFFTPWTGYP